MSYRQAIFSGLEPDDNLIIIYEFWPLHSQICGQLRYSNRHKIRHLLFSLFLSYRSEHLCVFIVWTGLLFQE